MGKLLTCKDCVFYDSPNHSRRRRLGYCRRYDKEVSPYDPKCGKFMRKIMVHRGV